jgi:hypothetical protein
LVSSTTRCTFSSLNNPLGRQEVEVNIDWQGNTFHQFYPGKYLLSAFKKQPNHGRQGNYQAD